MPVHGKSRTVALMLEPPTTETVVGDARIVWTVPEDMTDHSLKDVKVSCYESGLGGATEVMVDNIKFDDPRVSPGLPSLVTMLTANASLGAGATSVMGKPKANADADVVPGHRIRINVVTLNGASPAPKGVVVTLTFS